MSDVRFIKSIQMLRIGLQILDKTPNWEYSWDIRGIDCDNNSVKNDMNVTRILDYPLHSNIRRSPSLLAICLPLTDNSVCGGSGGWRRDLSQCAGGEISLSVPVQEAEVLEYPVRSWLASSQHLDLLDRRWRVLSGGSAVIMLVILSCNTSNMTHSSIPTFPIKSLTKNIYFKSKPFFLINFLIKANDARYKLVADSFHLCNRKFQFLNHKDI